VHVRCIDSTNDRARELATAGAPHGTLVTAREQTAGRGRQGRRWSAPAGQSLLMSLVLRWPISDSSPSLLPLIAAVAVCDVVGPQARVKWPNDIVFERAGALAKLAGVLAEGRPQEGWAVLGIGLNVAVKLEDLPEELGASAASLDESPDAIEPLLGRLLGQLEQRLEEPAEATLAAWRARDALRGREIAWAQGHGQARGIDSAGGLVVELADGRQETLDGGEVHLE
jgi:BirA family biotin operon repressor/biotin-[acetyl-CoA-carboxylase] ligase